MSTPVINPSLVPTVPAGSIFTRFNTDQTLQIRWLTSVDPAYYGALNRPHVDIVLRQLILAKAIDQLNASLGRQAIFPWIIQPRLDTGSSTVDIPLTLIRDINITVPGKWTSLRLAKMKRISGHNTESQDSAGDTIYTFDGIIRFIFTATIGSGTTETALLYADYVIDSDLTYQLVDMIVVTSAEESVVISPTEANTIGGKLMFMTMDTSLLINQNFLLAVAPPAGETDANSAGVYPIPSEYEVMDSVPDDPAGDFSNSIVSHGTGMLTDSAWNAMPDLDSDIQTWIDAANYPFDALANRTSTGSVVIPLGLFREFDIVAPAGDQPTGDVSGTYYPVWITRIERVTDTATQIRVFFATYNVTDDDPSLTPIEFATLDLVSTGEPGDIVAITPLTNLQNQSGADAALWGQHFGRGHVILSDVWTSTSTVIADFFAQFELLQDDPADIEFTQTSTRISSFGISRVPKYIPTIGQAQALRGSSARLVDSPTNPSDDNRYVTEADQGLGDRIDLEAQSGITPNSAIERFGYTGSLCHRVVKLIVNSTLTPTGTTVTVGTFYDTVVLPRLRILYGRDPIFGDQWHNGTRLFFFNGDTWQG